MSLPVITLACPAATDKKDSGQYPLAAATTRLTIVFFYSTDVSACGNRTEHGSRSKSLCTTLEHSPYLNISVVGYTNPHHK